MAIKRQAIIISVNTIGETVETTLAFEINTSATYQNLDTAMRNLNNLTTNTYSDTHIVNTLSLNAELGN